MGLKDTPRELIPWYPTIDENKCSGCKTCYKFCSHNTYSWSEERHVPVVSNPYKCVVGCSGCRPHCPEAAISFPPLSILKQFR